MHEIAAAFPRF